jgi:DNA topoisomerase-1
MTYELIISEKPNAAKKIAEALAEGKVITEKSGQVSHYHITHKGKDIIVACAVGHLYTVAEKEKSFKYPSFDLEWRPTADVDKGAAFSKKYLTAIKKAGKKAKSFVVACDYDIEGEVIGLNIIKYALNQKDASRMKFSTLVKEDLIKAYDQKAKHLDWPQARAGETRHFLDWMYGINLSRALTLSVKNAGSFKILSSGRVQGPALKIIVDKEKDIRAFKPEPFWLLQLITEKQKRKIEAYHEKDKFWDKKEVEKIYKRVKGKKAHVKDLEKKQFHQEPPTPFDLGSLQTESYRLFGIQPKHTLQIAQNLYMEGVTSYPRTSSQKLPKELGYVKILNALAKNPAYERQTDFLLKIKNLTPNEGQKTDAAHPAIYPTGLMPKRLEDRDKKVYDLIVKRFFATFGERALRETLKVIIDVEKENFIAKGTTTLEKGWHTLYEPYVKLKEEEMPELEKGEELKVKKLSIIDKETQPPKRYTPASIINELEKRGLGTKATRADIIDALYKRDYINDKSIEATELGIKTVETLHKYIPEILDEELTKRFEEEMEQIREEKYKPETVLKEAKTELTKLLANFKKHEIKIGKELIKAERETQDLLNTLGDCPYCKGKLKIMFSKKTRKRFIGCDSYPKCKTAFPLPQTGLVKGTDKVCEYCQHPIVFMQRKRARPQHVCVNIDCPGKAPDDKEVKKEMKELEQQKVEKECPKCGNPLVIRKSIYGEFLGCSTFPKCRHTEKIVDGPLKEDFKKK